MRDSPCSARPTLDKNINYRRDKVDFYVIIYILASGWFIMCSRSVLLLALGFAYISLAQESEPRMGRVVTTAATALRAGPDNSAPSLLPLPANTNLRWIEG